MMTSEIVDPSSVARGFAAGYAPLDGRADEMIEPGGALRPHWHKFVNMLDDLGADELNRRWDLARRLIHENGITHNVYGDPNGLDRPWNLDFVPLLTPASEWDALGSALQQRARLLDRLLADLYGPGDTLRAGVLPAELLWANPRFLRPVHGIDLPQKRHLHLYAADLVRMADGRFAVLGDRTQSPSGAGYSLENRIVLARALPSVFRQCNVQRLAPFFVAMRRMLSGLAPSNRDNPRVVLLTPGPYNETYFEHAYLARYLGYTLVQGNDLTVRDARVYLKTLGGLQRVDVILRRVDDDYCDPLELYANSFLGVPGLVEAIREGNVAVANALGSGVLQGPAFLPFLPGLCRYLLGEELQLPSVPTWWCGDDEPRRFVLENLHRLVVKPAYPAGEATPIFGDQLTRAKLEALAYRINAAPGDFVAQEHVMTSTVPSLMESRVEPRRFVVRAYLTATPEGYAVMSGGLTRIAASGESMVVSFQKGGGSKDTWVLADAPVSHVTLLTPAVQPIELSRGGGDLPSRIADDLFWLGRYVQRAEAGVRATRAALNRLLDQSGVEPGSALGPLSRVAIGHALDLESGPIDRELIAGVFARDRPEGLRVTVISVHRLARLLRDRISVDAWRILQVIENDLSQFQIDPAEPTAGVSELLDSLVSGFAAFVGLSTDSMTRGQAWRFLDMGHRIERAIGVTRLLRETIVTAAPDDTPLLEAVLEVADSSLTYRRRYLTHLETHAVVDLLLCDDTNPRAVAFQQAAIEEHLAQLPHETTHPRRQPDRQAARRLRSMLDQADIEKACRPVEGRCPELDDLLGRTLEELAQVSESIARIFFAHAPIPRRLLAPGQEGLS